MNPLHAKKKSQRLKDEIFQKFTEKNKLVLEHVYNCIELGVSIPAIHINWDERKGDLVVRLVGRGKWKEG